tara:strand:+ start:5248 stop:5976 length:729 start_codon:yes stop_codon:yes gene_type:complete
MKNSIRVSEHFYSLQGEGNTMGIPAIFVRLQSCNLMCGGKGTEQDGKLHNGATWRCDTIEVWQKGIKYSVEDFADLIIKEYGEHILKGCHLVITGGEPLMQQRAVFDLILDLIKKGYAPFIEIETNGTILPSKEMGVVVNLWNVSPKLSNSGEILPKRYKPKVLEWYTKQKAIFKFVISNYKDWEEVKEYGLPNEMIRLMPAASDIDELNKSSKLVSEICINETIKFSSRLQIILWNKTTGV